MKFKTKLESLFGPRHFSDVIVLGQTVEVSVKVLHFLLMTEICLLPESVQLHFLFLFEKRNFGVGLTFVEAIILPIYSDIFSSCSTVRISSVWDLFQNFHLLFHLPFLLTLLFLLLGWIFNTLHLQ